MTKYSTEKEFMVAEGTEGEVYVYIKARSDHPASPSILYDGFDHAVFLRSPQEKIILDYINPLIRDKLRKANNVVIVETILENIKDCYMASMQIVDKIPVDWGQIGLKTWEEVALQA
ncbi:MAG: hypothetical protein E7012_07065 [Alphaproteobacteria bacterium]|nr:hypothetical protein [Alphaproteobacteria bacterium]